MRFSTLHGDGLQVMLEPGESIKAESDALVAMPASFTVTGRMDGGLWSSFMRAIFGGESMFFQVIQARGQAGEAWLAPVPPGDVVVMNVHRHTSLLMQRGAFLACEPQLAVDTAMHRNIVRGLFSGTGMFLLRVHGEGQLAISAYGSILTRELKAGEQLMVDTGHLLAWTEGMDFRVDLASRKNIISSMTSGEMLMCYFQGPGTVWIQMRNETAFRRWLSPEKKVQRSFGGLGGALIIFAAVVIFLTVLFFIIYRSWEDQQFRPSRSGRY